MDQRFPERWEGSLSPMPDHVRPVSWPMVVPAALGLMLFPRTLGPRLAQSSWIKALLIQGFSLFLGTGLVAMAAAGIGPVLRGGWTGPLLPFTGGPPPEVRLPLPASAGEWVRFPIALLVAALYHATDGGGEVWRLAAIFLGGHAACWAVGLVVMPFMAAGEQGRMLYARSVRLTFWATVCVIPLGLTIVSIEGTREYLEDRIPNFDSTGLALLCVALWCVWFLSVVVRMGARYAGPAQGPGWMEREPRCAQCGYNLTGQPYDGRCPECGADVSQSLADYRKVPAGVVTRGRWRKQKHFWHTVLRVLARRDFFARLAVHQALDAAVGFLTRGLAVGGLLITMGFLVFALEDARTGLDANWMAQWVPGLALVASAAALILFMGFSLVILRSAHVGRCGIRPMAITVCYASVLFLPACVFLAMCLWTGWWALDSGWVNRVPPAGDWGAAIRFYGCHVANAVPPIAAFTWAMFRLRRALKDVRFAAA